MKQSNIINDSVKFIYTYKTHENSKTFKYNELCAIETLYLILSASKLKKQCPNKIVLYTDVFLVSFFNMFKIFDEVISIENQKSIELQTPGKYNKKTLYKLYVISKQTEPFIHLDNDLFVNNIKGFDSLEQELAFDEEIETFFSYEELVIPKCEIYYEVYFKTLQKVEESLGKDNFYLNRFKNRNIAANCSIMGDLTGKILPECFKETINFFEENHNMLNKIENMQMFLEQYFQLDILIRKVGKEKIKYQNTLIRGVWEFKNWELLQSVNLSDGINHKIIIEDVKNFIENTNKIVHLSGGKFNKFFSKALCQIVNNDFNEAFLKLKKTFVNYEWDA